MAYQHILGYLVPYDGEKVITRNVGQCPTWWPPCRI